MAGRTSSPSQPASGAAAAPARKLQNSVRRGAAGSSSSSSHPPPSSNSSSTAASMTTTPTSTAVSTPRPSSPHAVASAKGRDLSTYLHLPIRLTLVPNGSIPERQIAGVLWAFDPSSSCVILSSPPTESAQSARNPTTAQNPVSKRRCYHLIKTHQIKKVDVLSTESDLSLSSPAESILQTINLKEIEGKVEIAVREDKKQRARIGLGVTEEAQALFDALGRTLPVRWADKSIVVMDEVIISDPYSSADVKGLKNSGERIERVRKVLEGERQRRLERQR